MGHDRTTPQNHSNDELQLWAYYDLGPGVAVTGWPSQGGMYTLKVCSRVDLEFLELDLFNNASRPPVSDPEWQNKSIDERHRVRLVPERAEGKGVAVKVVRQNPRNALGWVDHLPGGLIL